MNLKNTLFFWGLIIVVATTGLFAQSTSKNAAAGDSPILFTYGGLPVSKAEFLQVYEKLNGQDTALYSKKSVDDYLDLYTNFKIKVREAQSSGLDTLPIQKKELQDYRKQIAPAYLYDKAISEQLVREAYGRMQKDVRVRHILIACPPDASATDTLAAYTKILNIYNKLLQNKTDFAKLAKENSQDPSVKENEGDLGYITAFRTVYPFETVAYNTAKGNISKPFRTKFGYHVVLVDDIRPARGHVQVAHIFVASRDKDSAEQQKAAETKINELYDQVTRPEVKFEDIASRESQDRESAGTGGKLPSFGIGKMYQSFEDAAFGLQKPGDISKPVKTPIGWHILKLVEKKPVGKYEDEINYMQPRIQKDSRAQVSKTVFVKRLKKDFNFKEQPAAKEAMKKVVNQDLIKFKWKAENAAALNAPLFSIEQPNGKAQPTIRTYTQADFAKYMEATQAKIAAKDSAKAVDELYNMFVESSLLDVEESLLDTKYPEFARLMNEFREGNLIYELMTRNVWNKASQDSTGLIAFHKSIANKYQWPKDRVEAVLFICKNAAAAKTWYKAAQKKNLETLLNDIETIKENPLISFEQKTYERGQNPRIDQLNWTVGLSPVQKEADGTNYFAKIISVTPAGTPKKLEDVRGYVISEYQAKLEKDWMASLRQKYPISVNKDVLESLYKK